MVPLSMGYDGIPSDPIHCQWESKWNLGNFDGKVMGSLECPIEMNWAPYVPGIHSIYCKWFPCE